MTRHHQQRRKYNIIPLSPNTSVRSICLIITFIFLYIFLIGNKADLRLASSPIQGSLRRSPLKNENGGKQKHRLAIVIPFIGQDQDSIPPYLELFCATAAGSARLVDFLIFHDGVFGGSDENNNRNFSCPDNVIFHSFESTEEFSRTLIRVVDRKSEESLELGGSREKLASIVAKFIRRYPYVMVEFKPALGHLFEKYLENYTHWGYSDLDVMVGDLERWISLDELENFDIVTYGFGDQHRLYLRGQFTFHRNDPEKINQLWRQCDYLSHMDRRFANVLSGEKGLLLESAEGCYSEAVLKFNDIKIKYAVKAFTDVDDDSKNAKDTAYTHGVYVGTGRHKDKTVIYKARIGHPEGLLNAPNDWFEKETTVYANPQELLYKPIGERERLPTVEKQDANCMYWVQKKYQSRLCIDGVDTTDTIYWINGQLYKEKYELAKLPGDLVTAPFFHFQEWKRYFRTAQLGGFRRNGPYTGFVLVKDGVLPIYSTENGSAEIRSDLTHSPLGHTLFQWHQVGNEHRDQLPRRSYCLQSTIKERPPTTNCKFMTSWWDSKNVEILSSAPDWSMVNINSEVTMAITLQLHSGQLDPTSVDGFFEILALYLNHWQGRPVVIIVHIAGASPPLITTIRAKLGPESDLSDFGMGCVLVGAIFSDKHDTFSRKALVNMAIDASPTRFVLSGYELERGIVPSLDTVYLAHRVPQIHKDSPGAAYIIPQFGLLNGTHDFTVDGLEKARSDSILDSMSKFDEDECEGYDAIIENEDSHSFEIIESLWWKLVTEQSQNDPNAMSVEEHASALENIQSELMTLLSEKEHYALYATNASPILLIDNHGPRAGMVTSDMVREVDEFGGKMCYNSLRLAQMATLGYNINILTGAFAISIPALRKGIGYPSSGPLGASRCDGCFFFTKDRAHEDILENISFEERQRPAKISILQRDFTRV